MKIASGHLMDQVKFSRVARLGKDENGMSDCVENVSFWSLLSQYWYRSHQSDGEV